MIILPAPQGVGQITPNTQSSGQSQAEPLEQLLQRAAATTAGTPGLRRMMLEGEAAPSLAEVRARLLKLFEAPLAEAKRAGRVDKRITKTDVLLLMQMREGA